MRRQLGVALIEIIIGLAIIGSVFAMVLQMQSRNTNKQRGVADAEYLQSFQQLAAQYFLNNIDGVMAAIATGANANNYCQIGSTPSLDPNATATMTTARSASTYTCAIDGHFLKNKGLWPSNMQIEFAEPELLTAGSTWRYVAIFRRPMIGGVLSNNVEMLVVPAVSTGSLKSLSTDQWSQSRIARVMQAVSVGGQSIGYSPIGSMGECTMSKTSQEICGNGWKVNLSDWIDGAGINTLKSSLP